MMPHNPVIRAYCRQVGKILEVPRKHKQRLLDGLERELEERFASVTGLTLETLYIDAGLPEESASVLMECVDEKERTRHQLLQKLLSRLAIIALVALVVVLIIYYFYAAQHSVDYTEVRIIQTDIE